MDDPNGQLNILSSEGGMWRGQMDPTETVETLKKVVFDHFYPNENVLGPENFRLIHLQVGKTLGDTLTIEEAEIPDGNVLFFVPKMGNNVPDSDKNLDLRAPTMEEIKEATKDLPKPQVKENKPGQERISQVQGRRGITVLMDDGIGTDSSPMEFQMELRKIVVSLTQVMGTLLRGNKDADAICDQFRSRLQRRLDSLKSKVIEYTSFTYPPAPPIESTPWGIIMGLEEIRKREFIPDSINFAQLRELGYSEERVLEALRLNKNLRDSSTKWLKEEKHWEETDLALDRSGHLYTSIVTAPQVRLGLTNPKMLVALLSILESPSAANMWLSDPDAGPVLSEVFKIYHSEKHHE